MAKTNLEVWVLVDAQGDYAVGPCQPSSTEAYEQNVGSLADANGYRLYQLNLTVTLPEVVEVSAELPEDGGDVALTVK